MAQLPELPPLPCGASDHPPMVPGAEPWQFEGLIPGAMPSCCVFKDLAEEKEREARVQSSLHVEYQEPVEGRYTTDLAATCLYDQLIDGATVCFMVVTKVDRHHAASPEKICAYLRNSLNLGVISHITSAQLDLIRTNAAQIEGATTATPNDHIRCKRLAMHASLAERLCTLLPRIEEFVKLQMRNECSIFTYGLRVSWMYI